MNSISPCQTNRILTSCMIIILLKASSLVFPQEIYLLDLERSIAIAKEKSHKMLILNQDLIRAKHLLKSATSSFKTHINLDLMVPNYTETIRQWEDSSGITFFPVKQLRYYGYLTITQPLPTDGQLYLSSGLDNFNDYSKNEKLLKLNTQLGFIQPIEAFYSYNQIKSEFKKAKLNYELSFKSLKRAELELLYEISFAFYEMVATKERKDIARQALEIQQEAYGIAQDKFEAGLIREVESLQMEVDLGQAKNDYDIAEVDYKLQINYFKQQLGLSLQDSINLISDLSYNIVEVDEKKALEYGLNNRMELREKEIEIELSKLEIRRKNANRLIKGSISGYYDFIGIDKKSMPISFGEAVGNSWDVMRDRPGNFGIAFRLTVPIFDWGENKAIVRAAEAELKKNQYSLDEEKINVEREIINTVKRLKSSLRRLQLLEKNTVVAEKNFNISRQRFSNGDIDSQALALDRIRLNVAYISHLESFISYKLLLADLMRQTYYDFENDRPILQQEM